MMFPGWKCFKIHTYLSPTETDALGNLGILLKTAKLTIQKKIENLTTVINSHDIYQLSSTLDKMASF